jgi:hypothetical protein
MKNDYLDAARSHVTFDPMGRMKKRRKMRRLFWQCFMTALVVGILFLVSGSPVAGWIAFASVIAAILSGVRM